MVTVTDYALRTNKEGKEFFALILQGGISMVQSKHTGNFYITAKTCSIGSTFNEQTCKTMIGEQIPGSIQKQACDPFEYVVKETGEILQLTHRWVYVPEGATIEEAIWEDAPVESKVDSSSRPLFVHPAL